MQIPDMYYKIAAYVNAKFLGLSPQAWRDWYYGLARPWPHYIVNWSLHGLTVAVVVFVCAVPGFFLGDAIQYMGAAFGYVAGVGFYVLREGIAVAVGSDAPWYDHVGDVFGPIVFGLVAFSVFS